MGSSLEDPLLPRTQASPHSKVGLMSPPGQGFTQISNLLQGQPPAPASSRSFLPE